MLSTKNYLHLAFDHENDIHYTDSMLALDTDSRLWYELRQQNHFDIIVFVKQTPKGLRLQTLDTLSEQILLLKPEGFLSFLRSQQQLSPRHISRKEFTLRELGTSEADFLQWMQDRVRFKELKKKTSAFVFTLNALETVYESSPERARQTLSSSIVQPDEKNILIVRLSPQPGKLAKAFLQPDSLLPRISPQVEAAVSGQQESLADALDRYMEGQILKLHMPEDLFPVLLYRAVIHGEDYGSLAEIRDQAAYLQYNIIRHGRWLPDDPGTAVAVRHREIYEKLADPAFRTALRSQTQALRQEYASLPIADAMAITSPAECCSWLPEYDDPVVRDIRSLQLPREEKWQGLLTKIQCSFQSVWNKPRNEFVCLQSQTFLKYIQRSIIQQDWDTAREALQLLNFCSEQLCADPAQKESLDFIFSIGSSLLDLSHNIFLKKGNTLDFDLHDLLDTHYGTQVLQEREIIQRISNMQDQEDLMKLYLIRSSLYTAMKEFSRRNVSDDVLEQLYREKARSLQAQAAEIMHAQQNMAGYPIVETDPQEAEAALQHLDEEAADTQEQEELDRLAGERLLQREGLF